MIATQVQPLALRIASVRRTGSRLTNRRFRIVAANVFLLLGLFGVGDSPLSLLSPGSGTGGQQQLAAAEPKRNEEHPFALVALASLDRVRARAGTVAEAAGSPEDADKLLTALFGGDDSILKLFNSPAFDSTRPFGVMSFPHWGAKKPVVQPQQDAKKTGDNAGEENDGEETVQPNGDTVEEDLDWEDRLLTAVTDPIQMLVELTLEEGTLVICIPAKDREKLLEVLGGASGEKFVPMPDRPGWFWQESDHDTKVVFSGRYLLLIVNTEDKDDQSWDRQYPDFEKLAKPSLGQNGFVYTLYRRGLPPFVREGMVEAIKAGYAATLQRQDDEPAPLFQMRTMFGPLATEWLDVALTQIEEFRITGHVDSRTHNTTVDVELVGGNDGKLAKFTSGLTAKSHLFASIPTDDKTFAATMSFPLTSKSWKPVVEGLRTAGQIYEGLPWLGELAHIVGKSVEAGQFEMHMSMTSKNETLVALRLSGGKTFPSLVQAALEKMATSSEAASSTKGLKVAVESVEGIPIHEFPDSLLGTIQNLGFKGVLVKSKEADTLDIDVGGALVQGQGDGTFVVDGNDVLIRPVAAAERPLQPSLCWLAATPQGVWLVLGAPGQDKCPDWFKSVLETSLAKSPAPTLTVNRNTAPFRMVLRGLGATPAETETPKDGSQDVPIRLVNGTEPAPMGVDVTFDFPAEKTEPNLTPEARAKQLEAQAKHQAMIKRQAEQARERGDVLRDGANTISAELRPSPTGLRIRFTLEDAYFHWFARMLKHSASENSEAIELTPPDAPQAAPPKIID